MPMLASQSAGGVWEEAVALRTTVGPGGEESPLWAERTTAANASLSTGERRPSTPPHPAGRAVDVLPT